MLHARQGQIGRPQPYRPPILSLVLIFTLLWGCSGKDPAASLETALRDLGAAPRQGAEEPYAKNMQAVDQLVEIGEPAVEPLLEVLAAPASDQQYLFAVQALGRLGDSRAVQPLLDDFYRKWHEQATPASGQAILAIEEALLILSPEDAQVFPVAFYVAVDPARESSLETREAAWRVLEAARNPEDSQLWIDLFAEASDWHREDLLDMWHSFGCPFSGEVLAEMMMSPDDELTMTALAHLDGMLSGDEAVCAGAALSGNAPRLVELHWGKTASFKRIPGITQLDFQKLRGISQHLLLTGVDPATAARSLVEALDGKEAYQVNDLLSDLTELAAHDSAGAVAPVLAEQTDTIRAYMRDADIKQQYVVELLQAAGANMLDLLAADLKHGDSDVRASAVRGLGELGDARAIPLLGEMVSDPAPVVRKALAEALGEMDYLTSRSFLEVLAFDQDEGVAETAVEHLRSQDAALLIRVCLESSGSPSRNACERLAGMDPSLLAPLLDALALGDVETIGHAYAFYIAWGQEGSEPLLVEALNRSGDSTMAVAFLNSGNALLEAAATRWAEAHGYTVVSMPGIGSGGSIWGGAR